MWMREAEKTAHRGPWAPLFPMVCRNISKLIPYRRFLPHPSTRPSRSIACVLAGFSRFQRQVLPGEAKIVIFQDFAHGRYRGRHLCETCQRRRSVSGLPRFRPRRRWRSFIPGSSDEPCEEESDDPRQPSAPGTSRQCRLVQSNRPAPAICRPGPTRATLAQAGVRIPMGGCGCRTGDILTERLWRLVKREVVSPEKIREGFHARRAPGKRDGAPPRRAAPFRP